MKALCVFFGVSRSGYYAWASRRGKINRYEQNRIQLKNLIPKVHSKDVTMGYRAINEHIKDLYGWVASNWLVHKCCRELGIVSMARRHWKKPKNEHHIFNNLIWNNWGANKPFKIIVSDTTILYHRKTMKSYEITIYLDVFNNEIIGYAVGDAKHGSNKQCHMEALNMMLSTKKKRGYTETETILHTDQGTVYSSRAFNEAHKNYNIIQSMSRAGTPTDNPIIESFNSWFKPLLFQKFKINERYDLEECIAECVSYFNEERKAFKLAYKNPVQYRTELGYT